MIFIQDSLKDLGIEKPYERKYPHPDKKRKVRLTIGQYMTHLHLTVKEYANPVWDDNEERWVDSSQDDEGDGIQFYTKFDDMEELKVWVGKIFPKWFSLDTHKFTRSVREVEWVKDYWYEDDVYCDYCDTLLEGTPDDEVDSSFYLGRQGGLYCGFEHYREDVDL